MSLICDGGTGVLQSRMKTGHGTKSYDMMLNMNLWSLLWLTIALSMGEAYDFVLFVNLNPHVLLNILVFGASSALGQVSVGGFGSQAWVLYLLYLVSFVSLYSHVFLKYDIVVTVSDRLLELSTTFQFYLK